jgi:20S proteasome subunit alpha 1
VRGVDTVCLVTEKRVPDKLIDEKSVTNLFTISDRIGVLTTGIAPDAKSIVHRLRYEAAEYRLNNGRN